MTARLDVTIHDRFVGTITNIAGDVNVVAIDPEYAGDPSAPPISARAFRDPVAGTYRERIRPTRVRVHPYFANLLPEGPLRHYVASRAGVRPVRDYPLLRLLGADLPGAVVLTDPERPAQTSAGEDDGSPHAGDGEANVLRFSLAGVQLKFSALANLERGLTIPASGVGGDSIIKLPDPRFDGVPENEFAMMQLARAVGIEVPEIALVAPVDVRGLPADLAQFRGDALSIRRFDRAAQGRRIHTEDFAQINAIYPEQKYALLSFDRLAEQIGELIGIDAALEFVRRVVFTIGIGNGDMHAKNWSLIYLDGRTPSLAPAYDYLSTIVFLPNDDMGLNFAGTKQFRDVDETLVRRFAAGARLPLKPVLDAARDMVERMHAAWRELEDDLPLANEDRAVIEKHMRSVPLFATRP